MLIAPCGGPLVDLFVPPEEAQVSTPEDSARRIIEHLTAPGFVR